jgi:Ca-activated chloride channel family protein
MANEDFENDDKDAGEIGAGQTITALYEMIPAVENYVDQQIAVFDVRYKKALGAESIQLTENVFDLKAPTSDRKEFSFAAGVAAFGMLLRDSEYKGNADFDMAYELVGQGLDNDPHGYRAEFQELINEAGLIMKRR